MKTLTLSGWAQPADALARIVPDSLHFDYSDYANPEASFEGLKQFADVERIVAWSMGGQLALRAIAAGVLKPRKLVLVASAYQFVSEFGMDDFTFNQFRKNYETDPARAKTRFHGLVAKGDTHAKRILSELDHHHDVENTARWLPWLDDLAAYTLEHTDLSAIPETLILHGEEDAIVPIAQSEKLVKRLKSGILERWKACAHAPHLHDSETFRARIR